MILGARIRERIDAVGTTQAKLARAIGVSPQAVSKMVLGDTNETAKLYQIARHLRTTPEYLTGESDDPEEGAALAERRLGSRGLDPDEHDLSGIVWIKEADLVLGLGGAFLEVHVEETPIPFPAHWLRQFSDSPPEMLRFIRGKGTSMEPTIRDGDICLLDLGRNRLDEQDELWACAYGDIGMIKRLRALPDGSVKISSDNDRVRDEVATDGDLHIIARCCGVFRKT